MNEKPVAGQVFELFGHGVLLHQLVLVYEVIREEVIETRIYLPVIVGFGWTIDVLHQLEPVEVLRSLNEVVHAWLLFERESR